MDKDVIIAGLQYVAGPVLAAALTFIAANYQNNKKQRESKINLIYHPVFQRLQAMERAIGLEFTLKNKGKEIIFKDVLSKKIHIFHDNLYELATQTEECIKTCSTDLCNGVYNRNMQIFDESIIQYNNFFRNNNYTVEEQKCLEIVMTKFNKWHKDRVFITKENIELISCSQFYTDCRSKQAAIFDVYIGAFAETINDAEKTLNELNGDLKGLIYKNITL